MHWFLQPYISEVHLLVQILNIVWGFENRNLIDYVYLWRNGFNVTVLFLTENGFFKSHQPIMGINTAF